MSFSTTSPKRKTILIFTNAELHQANPVLAVSYELLFRQIYNVHIASFHELESHVQALNAQAVNTYMATPTAAFTSIDEASTATFHILPGRTMSDAVRTKYPYPETDCGMYGVGFFNARRAYKLLSEMACPWEGDEYIACFKRCVEVIEAVEPDIVVVEPLLAQGVDAARFTERGRGRGRRLVILCPNGVRDCVMQPRLGSLWKFPAVCSGYPYPLSWKHVLPNAYLGLSATIARARSPALKAINARRRAEGIKGAYPRVASMRKNPAPILLASREEFDYPLYVPDHVTLCGPILRPCGSITYECPELAKWLAQKPTVLVNLGSKICFDSEQAMEFVDGLRTLLDARPDLQILWKLRPDREKGAFDWIPEALECIMDEVTEGRVRLEEWHPAEPYCILQSGHVCCMVHHGEANAFNEAARAGVPQIVLPVWFDTYDYASRVEYLKIGVWASKKSAPGINAPELGKAFLRVLNGDQSPTMRQEARVIASKLLSSEGRVVAAMASEKVAWIGLGNIGRGMSRNIALKGPQSSPLILYNRTASKTASFADSINAEKSNSATATSSLTSAVKDATITFICVGNDPALELIIETLTSDSSLSLKDKIIVDCSTVHPDTSRRTHSTLIAAGASFIACPVFGAPNMADAGQMVVVPAGSPETIKRISPFLEGVTSKAVLDLGPEAEKDVGRASLMKVLGNTFILNTVETLAEGLVAAEKSGLGVATYLQWVNSMFPGPFAKYAERMSSGDYFKREEPLFAVDLARKDLRHAANLAESSGMSLPSVKVTDDFLKVVKEEKGVKGDIAGVYGAIRKGAGLPFDNQ
ncbi:uncharacterized protein BDV14DRAFT_187709 [Aspergillus stella-maris]|uniref:uncharacterized protein n=1 Tax=Aspergillus stella-maris TaxID=1810926 RepID=UPI003CCCB9D2